MKFNLAIKAEKSKAFSYFTTLSNRKKIVEIKRVSANRTLNQNSYLHLIIGYFGLHFGYTAEEAKVVYKIWNASTYEYEKNGIHFYRSSADLSKEEMANTIDKFRRQSAEEGCELPPATNQEWLRQIENEIERSKYI